MGVSFINRAFIVKRMWKSDIRYTERMEKHRRAAPVRMLDTREIYECCAVLCCECVCAIEVKKAITGSCLLPFDSFTPITMIGPNDRDGAHVNNTRMCHCCWLLFLWPNKCHATHIQTRTRRHTNTN